MAAFSTSRSFAKRCLCRDSQWVSKPSNTASARILRLTVYCTQRPRCPQAHEPNNSDMYQSKLEFPRDVSESEFDCLNLFITRPSAEALAATASDLVNHELPVYVYIHGGAYSFGAGTDPMWGKGNSSVCVGSIDFVANSTQTPHALSTSLSRLILR